MTGPTTLRTWINCTPKELALMEAIKKHREALEKVFGTMTSVRGGPPAPSAPDELRLVFDKPTKYGRRLTTLVFLNYRDKLDQLLVAAANGVE